MNDGEHHHLHVASTPATVEASSALSSMHGGSEFCLAGSRSRIYSFMFSAGLAGMSIGPCAAAATFAITGNTWHVATLQHVILVGMVLAVVPVLALLCFDDDLSLGAESDAVRHHSTTADQQAGGTGETDLHVRDNSQLWSDFKV